MVTDRDDTAADAARAAEPWRDNWQDYYVVLGVGRAASPEEIQRAYQERAFILDPSRFSDAPRNVRERASQEFARLEQALGVLEDAGLRQLYDQELDRLIALRGDDRMRPSVAPASNAPGTPAFDAPLAASAEAAPAVAPPSPAIALSAPAVAPDVPVSLGVAQALQTRATALGLTTVGAKPWGIPAILAVLVIPMLFWVSGFFVNVPDEQTTGEIAIGLVTTIVFKDFLFIGFAAAFAIWRYRLGWRSLGFRPFDRNVWWLPLAVVGATYVALIIYGFILQAAGAADPDQEAVQAFFDSNVLLPLTFVALVVMAPLSEETFFRGFIFAGLIRPFGVIPAIVGSGLLFGAFHVSDLPTLALLPPIALIGMGFAWIYARTGSLWLSIAAHALFNGISFAAMALT